MQDFQLILFFIGFYTPTSARWELHLKGKVNTPDCVQASMQNKLAKFHRCVWCFKTSTLLFQRITNELIKNLLKTARSSTTWLSDSCNAIKWIGIESLLSPCKQQRESIYIRKRFVILFQILFGSFAGCLTN